MEVVYFSVSDQMIDVNTYQIKYYLFKLINAYELEHY